MPANTILFPGIFPLGLAMNAAKLVRSQAKPALFPGGRVLISLCRPGLAPWQSVELRTELVLRAYPDSVAGLTPLVKGSVASREVLRRPDTRHCKENAGEYEVCGQSFHVPLQSPESL
jgi:hypothetical protein